MPSPFRAALIATLFTTAIGVSAPHDAAFSQAVDRRQIGTATLENVPPIPVDVKSAVQRYQNYREATFRDWLSDGSMLITTRFGATNQLHRVAAPGADRSQITFFDEPVANVWMIPGTNRFVLARDTGGDEWFQLYAMGLTGEPAALTEPGTRNQSVVTSKDGRLIAWSRASKGSGAYAIFVAEPADPASRRLVYQADASIAPVDISPDKKKLLVARAISNRETRLSVVDIATGAAVELPWTTQPARYEEPRFANGDRSITAITDHGSDVRRLVEIDIASGARTSLTPKLEWEVEDYAVSSDGRLLAYSVNEDGLSKVHVLDRSGGRALTQPSLPQGVVTGMDFSPDGKALAVSLSSATSAGDVWTWNAGDGRVTRWTHSELGGLDPKKLAEPKLIRFRSFDGLSVPAFVYRPATVAAGARTPVVIDIHGGPESQTKGGWNPGAQLMADTLGATIILPNVRGSDGYGKNYLNLDNGPKREDSVRDIGALLDWIAAQPNLDAKRVAVYGQSYGGYMSLAVMTHYADRLVGGVERYGISNFVTFLNNTEAYRRDNRRAEYGDERDPAMLRVFERINPLANVGKITKPMLVMQGANDPRVPKSESDQVVAEIRRNGAKAWYVVFADEGHGFLKKHNNDLRREVEIVFLKNLFNIP